MQAFVRRADVALHLLFGFEAGFDLLRPHDFVFGSEERHLADRLEVHPNGVGRRRRRVLDRSGLDDHLGLEVEDRLFVFVFLDDLDAGLLQRDVDRVKLLGRHVL